MCIDMIHFQFSWMLSNYYYCCCKLCHLKDLIVPFCCKLITGLLPLDQKSTMMAAMPYVCYRFHGTLIVRPIWEFFLLIQFSGISFESFFFFGGEGDLFITF